MMIKYRRELICLFQFQEQLYFVEDVNQHKIVVAINTYQLIFEKNNIAFTVDFVDHSTDLVVLFHLSKYRSELIEKK
jgi:hypothetical protein